MTIQEAIAWAHYWQEIAMHPTSPEELERAANAFSFALICLDLERSVVSDRLAVAGFGAGPLNQRVQECIAAATNKRS